MYLAILVLPLIGSIISGLLGRKIGTTGSHIITITCLSVASLLASMLFYEVGLCHSPVIIKLAPWIDSDYMTLSWEFLFDPLTVSMFIPVLYISTLIHLFSVNYMGEDPAKCYGKTLKWDKLSNSGNTLKLRIPNYSRKTICGQTNYLGKVTSPKMMETEMDNRGSKSEIQYPQPNIISVKEQRVDGSWSKKNLKCLLLRCTLMDFERNYHVKILSKQWNNRKYSTLNNHPKIHPWFLTGFTDAEGCFSVSVYSDAKSKLKWRVSPAFIIKLHIKDLRLLEKIKDTLGVGKIRKNGKDSAQYIVESFKELQVIVDQFNKYPRPLGLITEKYTDYFIFKQCFDKIKRGEHLTEKGLLEILTLKSSLNWGLSDKLKKAFPNVVPLTRPDYVFKGIPDPFWVSGFISGDGSFHIIARNTKVEQSFSVIIKFSIHLHIRELEVIKGLAKYFNPTKNEEDLQFHSFLENSKHFNYYTTDTTVILQITKLSEIINKIIPFFDKYPIDGVKNLDFEDFKKVTPCEPLLLKIKNIWW